MVASSDRVHGAAKTAGATGHEAGVTDKRVDATINKVDAT